jgi:biotin transporter BioY
MGLIYSLVIRKIRRSLDLNLNATLIGQVIILIFAIGIAIISFYLGKRKTTTPILASVLGFISGFFPPLALIYLIALVLKKEIRKSDNDHSRSNV